MRKNKIIIPENFGLKGAIWTFQRHRHAHCCGGMDEECIQGILGGEQKKHNLVPTVALTAHAAQLVGLNTYNIGQNLYIAIGTDTTAPALGDTTLGAEDQRKAVGSVSFSGNQCNATVFFNAGEVAGNTYEEFGFFGSGNASLASGTIDTGILFSHVADSVSVGVLETLTVSFTFTIS